MGEKEKVISIMRLCFADSDYINPRCLHCRQISSFISLYVYVYICLAICISLFIYLFIYVADREKYTSPPATASSHQKLFVSLLETTGEDKFCAEV